MDQTDKTKLREILGKLVTMSLPFIQKVLGNRFSIAGLAGLTGGFVDLMIEATDALSGTGEAIVMGTIVGVFTLLTSMKKGST
ncbi:MAG: hypothetical protein VW583_06280 [Betaproteobacteria bacterium]|jgi:hypothetical protein